VLRFRRPDGRPLPEVPQAAVVRGDAVKILRACHDGLGLRLGARTACPGWLGERLNVGWAIDVLHPRAQRSRPCPSSERGLADADPPTSVFAAGPSPILE